MLAILDNPENAVLHGLLRVQDEVDVRAGQLADVLRRTYSQSRVVWFAVVIPIAIFLGLALAAYLTVQCWRRGYAGFSGLVDWHFTSWTHFNVAIHFACI